MAAGCQQNVRPDGMDWRILSVDWSGAIEERAQRQAIWRCVATTTGRGLQVEALENGLTREETIRWLIRIGEDRPRMLIGLDFAFSLPMGYVAHRLGKDRETWVDVVEWCVLEGETVLKECPPPFWGRAGSRRPREDELAQHGLRSLLRETERLAGSAKPVFQLAGPGSVGTGTLRGIPWLMTLREAGFAIWPFDRPAERRPTVVEIYPRLFSRHVRKSNPKARDEHLRTLRSDHMVSIPARTLERAVGSDDAFDALVGAVGMWEVLRDGGFASYPQALFTDPRVQAEGWIWGVPGQPRARHGSA